MLRSIMVAMCLLVMPVLSHAQADKLKVALVLPGSVTDGTFNSAAAEGIKKAQEKYPNLQVSIRENTQVAEAQEALSAYARDGYDIVIGHGFQFADPAKRIHKRFPDTWFIINTAKVAEAPNLASFDNRWGDGGYMAGAVAALLSESGKIGNIPAIPVPTIQEYDDGFKRGAQRINPDIEVMSAYVGSFSDIAKAKEITTSMIDSGADVVSAIGNENVVGTLQAAKEKGVVMIGTAFDSAALAPDTIATTALINFDVNIDMAIGKVIDGTIEPKNYLLGLNENGIGLAPYRNFEDKLSAEDKAKVQEIMDGIRAGTIDDLPEIR
ncbi:BMP family ABC transporter substrate-binding protein [Pusillimonas sp. DMV24BSW_D]|uniref:BMP family protein n=1 Tax=Neopusillimonas aestuarii TaxID=2716226 RepID=UPI000DF4B338|nr:BMP family protein [Pusillimonas sp. DMV24BSW_D]QIM48292.1 BMP family ABC transporter substrate-binding protein [Pusillimonas sp. DMV24BSW_D]